VVTVCAGSGPGLAVLRWSFCPWSQARPAVNGFAAIRGSQTLDDACVRQGVEQIRMRFASALSWRRRSTGAADGGQCKIPADAPAARAYAGKADARKADDLLKLAPPAPWRFWNTAASARQDGRLERRAVPASAGTAG